jgi:hypothetical protein
MRGKNIMKISGFGQVWDNEKNRVLVDFESTPNKPGIIDITDQRTIDILIKLGYNEHKEKELKPIEKIVISDPEKTEVSAEKTEGEAPAEKRVYKKKDK